MSLPVDNVFQVGLSGRTDGVVLEMWCKGIPIGHIQQHLHDSGLNRHKISRVLDKQYRIYRNTMLWKSADPKNALIDTKFFIFD
jgi:hypothetical protein